MNASNITRAGLRTAYLLFVILKQINVLKVGVELNLVDRWRHGTGLQNPINMLREIIAQANGLSKTLGLQFLHLLPLLLMLFFLLAEEGRMDQIPN